MKQKPWVKMYRGLYTERRSNEPGPGVWIRHDTVKGDTQHTIFQIATDSSVMSTTHCYCGQDRSLCYQRAKQASLDFDRQRRQDAKQDRQRSDSDVGRFLEWFDYNPKEPK